MVRSAGEKVIQMGRGTVFPYQESILRRREVGGLMRRGIHLRMVRHVVLLAVVALSAFVVVVFLNANGGPTATLRSDFDDRSVTPIFSPIDLAFAPDGRMLIATQPGLLQMYEDGELLQAPALDLTGKLCSNSERGLLGVALDPSFSTNRFVYLYYTFDMFGECPVYDTHDPHNPVNRVSRFVMSGDTIDQPLPGHRQRPLQSYTPRPPMPPRNRSWASRKPIGGRKQRTEGLSCHPRPLLLPPSPK